MRALPRPLTEPWLISPAGKELVFGVWSRGELYQDAVAKALAKATAGAEDEPLKYSRAVRVENGIAIIPIEGPLFRKAGLFTEISAAASYEQIRQDLRLALADPAVEGILLLVNSPGGEANGCSELADEIFRSRSKKLIWSYVEGLGQSAGCWLYSSAEHVRCSDTALLGCIGVRQTIVDTSKSDEKAGIKTHDIVNEESPEKRDYPVDDEVLAKNQRQVNALAKVFLAAMARNRGVSDKVVAEKFGRGDSLVGQDAIDAGLADKIGNLDSTLAAMREKLDTKKTPALSAAAKAGKTDETVRALSEAHAAASFRAFPAADLKPEIIAAAVAASLKNIRVVNKEKPMPTPTSGARAEADPEKKMKKAEDKKPEDGADAAADADDMVKCEDCSGDGENPDGSKCKTCDGEGRVKKQGEVDAEAPDDEADAAADDEEPAAGDGDGDEDDKGAKKALAALAGLSPKASLSRIAATLTAKTSSLATLAKRDREIEELKARLGRIEGESTSVKANAFVTKMIGDGRTVEEKRAHLVKEYARAEKASAGSAPKELEPQLFAKGTFTLGRKFADGKGGILRKKDEGAENFEQEEPQAIQAAYAQAINKIAARDKIDHRAATRKAREEHPELYAKYAATQGR